MRKEKKVVNKLAESPFTSEDFIKKKFLKHFIISKISKFNNAYIYQYLTDILAASPET